MRFKLRKDGWPLCPCCGEDEVAILEDFTPFCRTKEAAPAITDLFRFDWFCYRCARDVWKGEDRDSIVSVEMNAIGTTEPVDVHVRIR